ncbi:hypothetical protein AWRI3580_g2470 [Hanseniaspora uvarum]|uniref:Uncharacterized protein n=1 Tax=Hanseniaspora uvarum TaxID=29833 RepID=A0A1E5RJY1_HANUV|nr:hypothetical protein AWRI3580_g2470 [Hanseniaspora uvarum]
MQIINIISALAVCLNFNAAYSINRDSSNIKPTFNVTISSPFDNATSFINTTGFFSPESNITPFYTSKTVAVTAVGNISSFISGIPEATMNTTTVGPTYSKYSTIAGTAITKTANTSNAQISITAATAHLTTNKTIGENGSVDIASMEKYPPTNSKQSAALVSAAKKGKRDIGKVVFSPPKIIKLSQKTIEVALEKVYQKYPSLKGKISAEDVTPNEDIFISVNGIGFTNNDE